MCKFNVFLRYIVNNSFTLGEKMSDKKLVRKILRYLPKRFDMKVFSIEEAQNISITKFDELIGSFLTFEMAINDKFERKESKCASFKVDTAS